MSAQEADAAAGGSSGHDSRRARSTARAADRVRAFATESPDARAVIEYLGRGQSRIVLLTASGRFGDVVVGDVEQAEEVCAAVGLAVTSWDRETSALVQPSDADRRRMAGTGR